METTPDAATAAAQNATDTLALLQSALSDHPKGFAFRDGQVRPLEDKPLPTRIVSLVELSRISRKPRLFSFDLPGAGVLEVELRGLSQEEASEADKLDSEIMPPKRKVQRDGKSEDEFDWADPGYKRKANRGAELKRARLIELSLVGDGFKVPGGSLEERCDWMNANLPPKVLNELYRAVVSLTTSASAKADFS